MSLHNKYTKDDNIGEISDVPTLIKNVEPPSIAKRNDGQLMTNHSAASGRRGEVVRWYPMRIFHSSASRQAQLREALDREAAVVETYVPERLLDDGSQNFVPLLVNYIFVRISLDNLQVLKRQAQYDRLRYVMQFERDEHGNRLSRIAHVHDRDMESFRKVVASFNDDVEIVRNADFALRAGKKVRITEGEFAGIEGTLKSIKKHLCVVVVVRGVVAMAITGVHRKHIQPID